MQNGQHSKKFFYGFDVEKVCMMSDEEFEALMNEQRII